VLGVVLSIGCSRNTLSEEQYKSISTVPSSQPRTVKSSSFQPVKLSGTEMFRIFCVSCHGPQGRGNLINPSIQGVAKKHSRETIKTIILKGKGTMPGLFYSRPSVSDQEMKELLDLIEQL